MDSLKTSKITEYKTFQFKLLNNNYIKYYIFY